ncbi:MAG TPA: PucR family transcriptional regulator ligand-binding domain-containing protein [Bacillota bacterium]|nr:PucR family transcriptional regulator ligand-binding domain-containing protein [Bacillota bacterium]
MRMQEVLRLPELAAGRLLAGAGGLHREVRGVTVIDAPDGIAFIRGGELVLSTLFLYRSAQEQLALVEELVRRGGAGLGIKLERFVDALEPEVTAAADALAFPIYRVPDALAWVDIINPVLTELLGRKKGELERCWAIQRRFISLALEGSSLEMLAQELAGMIRRSLAVVNNLTGETATADFPELAPEPWRAGPGETARPLPGRPNLLHISAPDPRCRRIVCRIGGDGEVDGWIIVMDQGDPLLIEELVAIEQAAVAVALEVHKARAVHHMRRSVQGDFLHHLLAGDFESEAAVTASARAVGWPIAPAYVGVVAQVDRLPAEPPPGTYRVGWWILDLLAREGLPPGCIAELGYQDRPVALIPVSPDAARDYADRQVAERTRELIARLGRGHPGLKLSAGVGRPRVGVLTARESYREAVAALELAPVLPGGGPVALFRDLGLYRLVGQPDHPEIEQFIHDTLGPILRADRQHRGEFVQTLGVFLDHGGSYRETAKALHVHHNTVRYRLARAQLLGGFDLGSARECFNLQLAVRLWRASRLYSAAK